jgi:hypothetical protein
MAPPAATTSAPLKNAANAVARPEPAAARAGAPSLRRNATDDEILGITYGHRADSVQPEESGDYSEAEAGKGDAEEGNREPDSVTEKSRLSESGPERLRGVLNANPELRAAWEDAQAYRQVFATPGEAQAATALLGDLNRMDALFFSRRPDDHTQLAQAIAELDPAAFASFARAANAHLENSAARGQSNSEVSSPLSRAHSVETDGHAPEVLRQERAPREVRSRQAGEDANQGAPSGLAAQQADFFHAANASAVEGVLEAIESQVERLLPEGVPKSARTRVVAEIYRELDSTLRSNRQLGQQMREAFKSGSLDADHQRAVVSLITGRARQALPGVAKRVLHEWTSTLVAANQERRTRQRSAERRVDIAGSGGAGKDGQRMGPRDIDYARLSDSDILNL